MTAHDHAPLLQVQGLRFAHPGAAPLFDHAALAIGPGITLLHDDASAGKTTLLRVLAGELRAEGRCVLAGIDAAKEPAAWRRQVFHADGREPALDALTPPDCAARWREGDPGCDEGTWRALVEGFALTPHLGKRMDMLSTGSRRKVALAAALASGRALVLLDEPTAALDKPSVGQLWQALARKAQAMPRQAVLLASSMPVDTVPVPLAATLTLPLHR